MTCDFAEEIEEIKMKWQFVRVGRREQATARVGWGRIFLPTHRKCAMDGAPRLLWLVGSHGKNNGNSNDAIRGSLHCATDDETVRCFGRDDALFLSVVNWKTANTKEME